MKEILNKRARIAYDNAKKFSSKKEYISRVKRFPSMVMSNGLTNSIAFAMGKGWDDLIESIVSWVTDEDCPVAFIDIKDKNNPLDEIVKLNSDQYRMLTSEVLAYMSWLRRFVSALSKENK